MFPFFCLRICLPVTSFLNILSVYFLCSCVREGSWVVGVVSKSTLFEDAIVHVRKEMSLSSLFSKSIYLAIHLSHSIFLHPSPIILLANVFVR